MDNPNRLNSGKSKNDSNDQILQKLPFRIIEVSSEEQNYPVSELLNHTPFSRGWQSSRFPEYPQEIILEFPSTVRICQIQFLSHQYKITSKIEIFISNSNPNSVRKLKKIGHLSLDSNERSNFQARELKSVYLDYLTQKLKFSLHRCHTNIHNTYSQVGLIAINILGEYTDKSGDNINMNNFIKHEATKLEDEMNFDPATLKRLNILYKAKEKAVELEDFDEAKKIKEAIDRLKSVSSQLIQLEERKRIAIKNDDFDAAKMLKYEIERLRNAVSGIQLNDNYQYNASNYNNNQNQESHNFPPSGKTQSGFQEKSNVNNLPISKKAKNEVPLTSDMVLEGEDKIYQTKKTNPNEGYKLKGREEINKKVDVDNLIIKGISRDFNEIVNRKMNEDIGGSDIIEKDDLEEDISATDYKKAEPLISILSINLVKKLFSKNWKNKEESLKILTDEIEKYPNSDLLKSHTSDKILTATVGAAAYILSCNVSQPLTAAMNLLKIMLNKFRGNNIQGYLRQDFDNYVDQCMLLLIEKVGDANLKLKEKAENTVMEFANSPLVGHKTVFEDLITGQVKKTLVKSARHLSGRLNLITRMINNFGFNTNEVPIDTLMNYTMSAYKDPNKEVREAAFNLILNIYKYIGPDVRNYYKDLRPAQINLLEEEFENMDGLNQGVPNEPNEENDEVVNESRMVYNYGDGVDGRKTAKKGNKSSENVNEYQENKINHIKDQGFKFNENPSDESTTCRFCGFFDPNFDEDSLFIHFYKECPMLSSCFKCKQTIEISAINYHYINECNFKKEFKTCTRCKEAVHTNEYDRHVAEKACMPAKSPNVANRCPLCHIDFTPPGNAGWEVHLLQNTCQNNPRTNY